MNPLAVTACLALTAASAGAQCAFSSVSVSSYGQGCNPVFANSAVSVAVSLDATQCSLSLDVNAFGGCCNTFLTGELVVLGLQPANAPLPIPPFAAGCTLLASPDLVLFAPPNSAGNVFQLQLPTGPLPPTTLYAQSAVLYFTTIGLTFDWAFGAGAQIDLQ